ncbi:MAG: YbaK/EbsC family protein [Patescibacteria group bacterium]
MEYHKVTGQITSLLKEKGFWFETFEHEPVKTSEEAAKIRPGYTLHQGAKAMIVRVKMSETDKRFIMLVFPADLRYDNAKVAGIYNAKDVRLATEKEISDITDGVQAGGIPPFGNLFNLDVVADPKLFDNEKIVFNAGDRRFSVAMFSKDFKAVVNPRTESIT